VSAALAIGLIMTACQSGAGSPKAVAPNPATTPTTGVRRVGPFGPRTFQVHGVELVRGDWLTIALHPDPRAVRVRIAPPKPVEVCPASVDGGIGPANSSWPKWFHFPRCERLDYTGAAMLRVTDGRVHVAFGIQTVGGRSSGPFDVTVAYAAEDSFMVVIPPVVAATHAVVSFVPQTATVGAQPYDMPSFGTASAFRMRVAQQGRPVMKVADCDFGSEIGCVGPVAPNLPVTVAIAGRSTANARLAVYVSWA